MVAEYLKKSIRALTTKKAQKEESEEVDFDVENVDMQEEKPKKKGDEHPPLLRPIIFVCNDGFARPLKALVDLALRIKVLPATDNRIKERVYEIIRAENLGESNDKLISEIIY